MIIFYSSSPATAWFSSRKFIIMHQSSHATQITYIKRTKFHHFILFTAHNQIKRCQESSHYNMNIWIDCCWLVETSTRLYLFRSYTHVLVWCVLVYLGRYFTGKLAESTVIIFITTPISFYYNSTYLRKM